MSTHFVGLLATSCGKSSHLSTHPRPPSGYGLVMVFFVGLRGGEYELIGEDSRRQRFLRRAYGAVALALGCFFVLYVAGVVPPEKL